MQNIRSLRNEKGFTLIELAVVLVIIGIILGAVVKGQDLIVAARAKKVIQTMNAWSALTWTYMDRMGRMPGDAHRNGVIGDDTAGTSEQTAATSAIGEMATATTFINPPANPVIVGGTSFYIYLGNVASNAGGVARNAIIICGDAVCGSNLSNEQIAIIQAVDTSIDETAEMGAGQGNFRGTTAAPTTFFGGTPATMVNNRYAGGFSLVTLSNSDPAGIATVPWSSAIHFAGVWMYDRPL